jgi:hypothetical protein
MTNHRISYYLILGNWYGLQLLLHCKSKYFDLSGSGPTLWWA